MPFAEDQRLNFAESMGQPSGQAQRDYLNLINQGTERNLGQINDVGQSMTDFQRQKYATLAKLPGQIQDKYREGKGQAWKEAKDQQGYTQQEAENTEYAKGAEDAQRKRDILQQKNPKGMSLEEEAIRNDLAAGTQGRMMTNLRMQELSQKMANEGQETAYQRAVRGFRGAIDPKTHQIDPKALTAIENRLGETLPKDQLAAAKAEAMRVDPTQQVLQQSLKDATPEGMALRETKRQSQESRKAIDVAEKAYQAYESRGNKLLDNQQAADAREKFAKILEDLGETQTAAAIRQNAAERAISGGGQVQSVEEIMKRGLADLAEKVQGNMEAAAPALGQWGDDPELAQTYQALEAKKKKYGGKPTNSYGPSTGQPTQTASPKKAWGAGPGGQPIGGGIGGALPAGNMQNPGAFNQDSFNPGGRK